MKKCELIISEVNSFKKRACGKKAVLYMKDLSGSPIGGMKELHLCSKHSYDFKKFYDLPFTIRRRLSK